MWPETSLSLPSVSVQSTMMQVRWVRTSVNVVCWVLRSFRLLSLCSPCSPAWCLWGPRRTVSSSYRTSAWSSPTPAWWWPSSWWRASSMWRSTSGAGGLATATATTSTSITTRDRQVVICTYTARHFSLKHLQPPPCCLTCYTTSPSMTRRRMRIRLSDLTDLGPQMILRISKMSQICQKWSSAICTLRNQTNKKYIVMVVYIGPTIRTQPTTWIAPPEFATYPTPLRATTGLERTRW